MNFIVIQPRMMNTNAWINRVAFRFMTSALYSESTRPRRHARAARACSFHERVGGREPQRDADADDERRVDQAQQEEYFRLQDVHELRLTRRRFDVLASH